MNKQKLREIIKRETNFMEILETLRHRHTLTYSEYEHNNIDRFKKIHEKQSMDSIMFEVGKMLDRLEEPPVVIFNKEWIKVYEGEELQIEVILCRLNINWEV